MEKLGLGAFILLVIGGVTLGVMRSHVAFDICKAQGRSTASCILYALR